MALIVVDALEIDEENADKAWEHGISEDQLRGLVDRAYTVVRNRTSRRAPYVLIGQDTSGQCIATPIEPTVDPFIWRPITAWYCKASEWARLPRDS